MIALISDFCSHLRLYFRRVESSLFLTLVADSLHLFIPEDVIALLLLQGFLLAHGCIVTIEVMVCRLDPVRII